MSDIFTGDVGTVFEVSIKENNDIVDVSGIESILYVFTRPGGSTITKAGALKTDGQDGRVVATIEDGDFTIAGLWKLQLTLEFSYGKWRTSEIQFNVK